MKKLIAVSVALALAATGAFAQEWNVGGFMSFATDFFTGDNDDSNDDVMTVPTLGTARLQGSGSVSTGVGEFGGWVRIQSGAWMSLAGDIVNGHVWWAPNDMFRMTMGSNPDSWLAMDGRARWNFYRMVNDNIGMGFHLQGGDSYGGGRITNADYQNPTFDPNINNVYAGTFDSSFFGGNNTGLLLQLSPMEMLNVNIMLPVGWSNGIAAGSQKTGDIFAGLTAQLGLNLDFGTIGLTYAGSSASTNNGSIFAYLGLSAIENVGIDFGVGFHLTENAAGDSTSILGIGAAVDVAASADFGLIARINAEIRTEEDAVSPLGLMFELLPSYALTPNVRGFLTVGLALNTFDVPDWDMDPSMGFHIGPYIEVGSTWGPSFYAGFEFKTVSHDDLFSEDAIMSWRVPIGMYIAF